MNEYELGPNGGLMYCIEFLEKNFDWLKEKLDALTGQVLNNLFFFNLKMGCFLKWKSRFRENTYDYL